MKYFEQYKKNYHSQNGENGIIEELVKRLEVERGWYVDVGAWDGVHLSNVYFLLQRGWRGVGIESDEKQYQKMIETSRKHNGRLICLHNKVSSVGNNSLDRILPETDVPKDFDILNIDIDSFDWWIWKELNEYKPKIVVIEVNSAINPGISYVQQANQQFNEKEAGVAQGASFTAMLNLGLAKGYRLVLHTGNMIFVQDKLVEKIALPKVEIENPNLLFDDSFLLKKWINRKNLIKVSRLVLSDVFNQVRKR